jgi:hypothetical protein
MNNSSNVKLNIFDSLKNIKYQQIIFFITHLGATAVFLVAYYTEMFDKEYIVNVGDVKWYALTIIFIKIIPMALVGILAIVIFHLFGLALIVETINTLIKNPIYKVLAVILAISPFILLFILTLYPMQIPYINHLGFVKLVAMLITVCIIICFAVGVSNKKNFAEIISNNKFIRNKNLISKVLVFFGLPFIFFISWSYLLQFSHGYYAHNVSVDNFLYLLIVIGGLFLFMLNVQFPILIYLLCAAMVSVILISDMGYFAFKSNVEGLIYIAHVKNTNYVLIDENCYKINETFLKSCAHKYKDGNYYINEFSKLIGTKLILKEKRNQTTNRLALDSVYLNACNKVEVHDCLEDSDVRCKNH